MRKTLLTLILTLAWNALFSAAPAPDPPRGPSLRQPGCRFVNYTVAEGLSSNIVQAIVQDAEGRLWVGTRNGLNCFDGIAFRKWDKSDGLPDHRINALCTDAGGRLWIGTGGGLCVRDGRRFTALPGRHIRALLTDSRGDTWAATKDSLLYRLCYREGRGIVKLDSARYLIGDFEGDYPYQQIFEDSLGRLWLGGRMVNSQVISNKDSVSIVSVPASGGENTGSYVTGLGGRLLAFDDYRNRLLELDEDGRGYHSLGRMPLAHGSLLRDSRGRIWAAGSYGLARVDTDDPARSPVFRHDPDDETSIGSTELFCLYEDRQGNLWVGGNNGLSVLSPFLQQTVCLTRRKGLPSQQVTALMQSRDGRLWIGTADKGAMRVDLESGEIQPVDYRVAGRQNEGYVSCLYEDRQGAVYIGLWAGCGFNVWRQGQLSRSAVSGPIPRRQHVVAEEDRITSNWIADFLEDSRGRFYVATWEGVGLNEWDRATGKTMEPRWLSPFKYPRPGVDSCIYLSSRLASRLLEDAQGRLVYGTTEAGLNIIDPESGHVRKYLARPGGPAALPDDYVTDLCLAADSSLWVATRGGLWTPSGRRLLEGLCVQSVEADGSGRLWAGTENGLFFIDRDSSIGIAHPAAGFLSDSYGEHVSCRLQDGRLAFGGPSGVVLFDPDSLLDIPPSRLLLTERPSGERDLHFSFSSSDLALAARRQYRYRLEGVDRDWVEAVPPTLSGRYSGLPPGRYRLRIQHTDLFGRWLEGEEYRHDFVIPVPWWRRWPMVLLYGLVLFLLLWLFVFLREKKLKADRRRLEEAVKEKTLRIREELDTRNHFFSIVSHDLRNPVHGIQQLAAELERRQADLPREMLSRGLGQLRETATDTQSLLENLLMWSVSQKGMLEPVMRRESLRDIALEALRSSQESAAAKELGLEVDILPELQVLTDRNMLLCCLRNLTENAVKFSPREGNILVSAREEKGAVRISVSDQGPGMEAEILKHLTRPGRLGLVITQELLRRLHGRLSARNLPAKGLEITITINKLYE
ncbi:MAG: hypothetical protein IJ154_08345 [Bacteroidales bacterium]|nr:hypothetical protein [Bacteroidales bacterium]